MSKDKIIAAAIDVFSEYGYHRASMDEIALSAQVAKGTLYYHFPGKAQLFKTIVMDGFQVISDRIRSEMEACLALEEQIQRIIRHNLDLFLESRGFARIVFNELSNGIDSDVLDELKGLKEGYIDFLAGLLEEGRKDGVLHPVNCQLAAAGIVGLLDSSCNYYISHPDAFDREGLEQFLYTMITTGLFKNIDNR
ncbi:TetR/AcrR family transcriptional regulator [Paenibacillus spongiae]|uniref:TetR/AcrR family transcriptional regulator n=1 Tax=Paenibacillus spongiae TaxID=2909671 RepID=A0ABY5SFM0_9BACL|nr:TetR/AcrR family transcriptional regulator [Paenibacillus spongiae]UVI32771.1 TetR/AcrR family transcriptional regulator [Paenibacillus spongiae]